MKDLCRRVSRTLELEGPRAALEIEGGPEHLETCDRCFEAFDARADLDAALRELPVHDAPDALVERLLVDRRLAEPPGRESSRDSGRVAPFPGWLPRSRPWRVAVAATLAAGLGLVLLHVRGGPESLGPEAEIDGRKRQVLEQTRFRPPPEDVVASDDEAKADRARALGYLGGDASMESEREALAEEPEILSKEKEAPGMPRPKAPLRRSGLFADEPLDRQTMETGAAEESEEAPASPTGPRSARETDELDGKTDLGDAFGTPPILLDALEAWRVRDEDRSHEEPVGERREAPPGGDRRDAGAPAGQDSPEPAPEPPAEPSLGAPASSLADGDPAARFLAERERVDGLRFQEAEGIWRNTYLPGDPVLRRAALRLDRAADAGDERAAALERLGRPSDPVLDPPTTGALALSVRADRTAVEGPSRVLVQVGLRGTERRPGQRPPMEVALVLDLRAGDPDGLQRAAAEALVRHLRAGDRFWIFALGVEEPLLVAPEDLRSGRVRVALDDALGRAGSNAGDRSPEEIVERARAALASGKEDALGTESILLLAEEPLGRDLRPLLEAVHRAALDGVSTSAVAVGGGAEPAEIDALALTGQGRRRSLGDRSEASRLVESELLAASEIVARALRLRIRLAPDVRLVGVPGSHRLGAPDAGRAREVERALDLRIARERGIAADRDEDEDGVLILIPAFRAGDEHTVLLDVVVPGPGPVGEVSLRFKDLVDGRNGVVRDRLDLERGSMDRGPLEWAVRKRLVGVRIHRDLERAAADLEAGRTDRAVARIDALARLIRGLRARVPELAEDPDLVRDAALLEEVRSIVDGTAPVSSLGPSESLRLAAARRLLPPISPETEVPR